MQARMYLTLSLLILLGAFFGCSNRELDRKTAEKEIQSHFESKSSLLVVELGRVGLHCLYMDKRVGHLVNQDLSPDKDLNLLVATKAGYLNVIPDGAEYSRVSLTESGKAAQDASWRDAPYRNQFNGCDYHLSAFKVAEPRLIAITGIRSDEKVADVEFEWKWAATQLGKALRKNATIFSALTAEQQIALRYKIQTDILRVPIPVPDEEAVEKDTVKFTKYDDGWRSK